MKNEVITPKWVKEWASISLPEFIDKKDIKLIYIIRQKVLSKIGIQLHALQDNALITEDEAVNCIVNISLVTYFNIKDSGVELDL